MKLHPLFILPFAVAACDSDEVATGQAFDDPQVIVDFADEVVVPTYELLAARAVSLGEAIDALVENPDEAKLAAARAAWVAARAPWEQSEGFLFGPVDSLGIDPALDTWPLNETDLQAVLDSSDTLTAAYVANLPDSQKGFHALEFLLYGDSGSRTAAELTARQRDYLAAIAGDFEIQTARLASSWTDGEGGLGAYRDLFATAGPGNAAYPSLSSAAQEIVSGMAGICDEVANGKIADPFDARDPLLEESQFSHNSLTDFQNNMRSVENAYLGRVSDAGTSGRGLTTWVASRDAALDARIKAEITAAIAAIGEIPGPFSDAILDNNAAPKILAAQAAIRTLQTTLEEDLTDLILGR
ncbi:MAG TPA: imelysin family protein [Myxococcota bacterium]|nr:imelysin family protein [Myxococcota bacterium]